MEREEDLEPPEPVGSIRSTDSHRLHSLKEIVSLAVRDREEAPVFLCVSIVCGANALLKFS